MFSTADQCVMSVLPLVQLAPRAKARVNDMQVRQIMCKLQKVFQVCVSTSDRPSSACFFLSNMYIGSGTGGPNDLLQIQILLTQAMLRFHWSY